MNKRWKLAQHFELKWWARYLQGKDKQEYLANKKKYWQRLYAIIAPEVPLSPGTSILDLGCGPAGIYMLFDKNKVTAVDPLLDEYEKTLSTFSKADYPNVLFITTAMEDYEPKGSFDVVFCMNAINHVSDIDLAYKKLVACTRPKAKIIVSIDAHNHTFLKFLFRLGPGDILHPHQYDLKEYENFLEKNACKIIQTTCLKKQFIFSHYLMVAEKSR